MTISVYFSVNGVETKVPDDNLMRLTQSAHMFSSSFRLGATVCREFEIDIDKVAFDDPNLTLTPDEVILYEGLTKYATLVVDELNADNDAYYSFSLTDRMVRLGESDKMARPWSIANGSLQAQVNSLCSAYDLGTAPTLAQYGSVVYSPVGMTARQFVGYLAEILGGYAYISADNELVFSTVSTVATDTISVDDCSSFKVNESITYDRVVYDTPNRVVKYPEDGNYTGTGATYYINPDNQLMTDDTVNDPPTIDIESEVQYIYSIINGYTFYNIEVEKAPIDGSVKCGDRVAFVLDGITYDTIAEIDWTYNSMWLGGYKLAIDNQLQEETAVTPLASAVNRVTQYIDREIGEVGTIIQQIEENVSANTSAIIQNAQQITASVQQLTEDIPGIVSDAGFATSAEVAITAQGITNTIASLQQTEDGKWQQLYTYIDMGPNGITIGKSNSNIKGIFSNTSLDFVDGNNTSTRLAWLDATEGLGATKVSVGDANNSANRWQMVTSANGAHLRFTRHN